MSAGLEDRQDDPASSGRDRIRLVAIREQPLSVDECLQAVADPAAGGTTVFVGAVRDHDAGPAAVCGLEYSAHPEALAALRRVVEQAADLEGVRGLAAVHRVGSLAVGDLAVVVAASADHRAEAFAACRELIEALKATVPIWKHQQFADGSQEWVGLP